MVASLFLILYWSDRASSLSFSVRVGFSMIALYLCILLVSISSPQKERSFLKYPSTGIADSRAVCTSRPIDHTAHPAACLSQTLVLLPCFRESLVDLPRASIAGCTGSPLPLYFPQKSVRS
jgi:hypothetical protein